MVSWPTIRGEHFFMFISTINSKRRRKDSQSPTLLNLKRWILVKSVLNKERGWNKCNNRVLCCLCNSRKKCSSPNRLFCLMMIHISIVKDISSTFVLEWLLFIIHSIILRNSTRVTDSR